MGIGVGALSVRRSPTWEGCFPEAISELDEAREHARKIRYEQGCCSPPCSARPRRSMSMLIRLRRRRNIVRL